MDYRDQLAIFGQMMPQGARIDDNKMRVFFTVEDEEGNEVEHSLPFRWCVCGSCEGKGKYVNPSIDAHGLTRAEMSEWDDEEREGYFSGRYDVICDNCQGKRVEPDIDTEGDSPAAIAWREWADDEDSYRAEREVEMAFGC